MYINSPNLRIHSSDFQNSVKMFSTIYSRAQRSISKKRGFSPIQKIHRHIVEPDCQMSVLFSKSESREIDADAMPWNAEYHEKTSKNFLEDTESHVKGDVGRASEVPEGLAISPFPLPDQIHVQDAWAGEDGGLWTGGASTCKRGRPYSGSRDVSLAQPLPRTCLTSREEPWEHEMLRLPARLLLFEPCPPSEELPPSPRSPPWTGGDSSATPWVSGGAGVWHERCAGEVRLLRDSRSGHRVRVLMRRQDKTRAPCLNHLLTLDMELRPWAAAGCNGGGGSGGGGGGVSSGTRAWAYTVMADYAEGRPRSRVMALQFSSARDARRWRAKFEEAQHLLEEA